MFPLSKSQELVWLQQQVAPGSHTYYATAVIDFDGEIDTAALRGSIAAAVERHDAMRLRISGDDPATAQQEIVSNVSVDIPGHDLRGVEDIEKRRAALLDYHMHAQFDLHAAPLARWTLVRLADRHWQLFMTEHHLVHDGKSTASFLRDVFEQYSAEMSGQAFVPEVAPSYEDYVAYTNSSEYRTEAAAAIEWWTRKLDGATFGIDFPGLGLRRSALFDFSGRQYRQKLSPDLMAAIHAAARANGYTVFAGMLSIFAELCRRHCGQDDLVIGTALANRPPDYERTLGMMVNTVPLRLAINPRESCRNVIFNAMTNIFDAVEHESAPIQDLVKALKRSGTGLDNPLFNITFSMHDQPLPSIDLPGLAANMECALNTDSARFDLDVVVLADNAIHGESGDRDYEVIWDYSAQRFSPADVQELAARYETLLREYVAGPAGPIGDLHMAVVSRPDPESHLGCEVSDVLSGPLLETAAAAALIQGPEVLSFRELDDRVRECAAQLNSAGLRAEDVLAVRVPRGIDAIVLLLACLRSGIVFAPLSMTMPAGRLAGVLRDLRPAAVAIRREDLPDYSLSPCDLLDASRPGVILSPGSRGDRSESAAYIIHTSGTTGVPKAVAVPAVSLGHIVAAIQSTYELTPDDRSLQFTDPAFDVFLEEVLPTLASGACVVIPLHEAPSGAELAALVIARNISVINLPTNYALSIAAEMRDALAGRSHGLRLAVIGGEQLSVAALKRVTEITDGLRVLNAYGVTESVITSSHFDAADIGVLSDSANVPLGRAVRGTDMCIVDEAGRPAPASQVGQIAVAAAGPPARYLDDIVRSAQRFTSIPARGDRTYYLTGDVGFQDSYGWFHFIGRQDRQVKVNGYRIELEEIELAVKTVLPGADCVVSLSRATAGDGDVLICLVSGVADEAVAKLPSLLGARLPRYAIPPRAIAVPKIPRDPGTGKPDLAAIATLAEQEPPPPAAGQKTSGSLWLQAFCEVLQRDDLDDESDFFRSGGHSLLVFHLLSFYESLSAWRPPASLVFEFPTPLELEAASAACRQPAESVTGQRPPGQG